jgi:hypothetical protein
MPAPLPASAQASWTVRRPLPPIDGESLDGFMARVAAHNMVDNALAISSLGGVAYGHRPDLSTHGWEGLPAVAECLQVEIADLQHRSYPLTDPARDLRLFFGTPLERRHLELRTRRFSPTGLRLSSHHRALWQLRLFPFCIESWEYLLDRCLRCHAVQRWYRTNGIDRCDYCVEDLRRAASTLVPIEEREAAGAAVGIIHPDPERRAAIMRSLPRDIQGLGNGGAFSLLVRLVSLVDHSIPLTPPGAKRAWRPAAPERMTTALAGAWTLLAGWPDAVLSLMNDRIQTSKSSLTDGNHGMSVKFLKRAAECPNDRTADAIEAIRVRVDLDGPRRDDIQARTMDLRNVTKSLWRHPSQLAEIRRRGGLRAVFAIANGCPVARYDRNEIEQITRAVRERLSFERAGSLLGISYHGIEQLAALGMLPVIEHPYFYLCYGGHQSSLKALQAFEELIGRKAVRAVDEPISLRRAANAIGGRLKPWGPIFEALAIGTIPYALDERPGLPSQRILVPQAATEALRNFGFEKARYPEIDFAASMTRRDAGEALNLYPREYTLLLKDYRSSGGQPERVVPITEVEKLAANFIGTSEVAVRLGCDARSAYHHLRGMGIGSDIPFLWDRSAVEKRLFPRPSAP